MKRSEINAVIREMEAFIAENGFHLPKFCRWTPEEWADKGHEYDEQNEQRCNNKRADVNLPVDGVIHSQLVVVDRREPWEVVGV